jgi:hypothetical protein
MESKQKNEVKEISHLILGDVKKQMEAMKNA